MVSPLATINQMFLPEASTLVEDAFCLQVCYLSFVEFQTFSVFASSILVVGLPNSFNAVGVVRMSLQKEIRFAFVCVHLGVDLFVLFSYGSFLENAYFTWHFILLLLLLLLVCTFIFFTYIYIVF